MLCCYFRAKLDTKRIMGDSSQNFRDGVFLYICLVEENDRT